MRKFIQDMSAGLIVGCVTGLIVAYAGRHTLLGLWVGLGVAIFVLALLSAERRVPWEIRRRRHFPHSNLRPATQRELKGMRIVGRALSLHDLLEPGRPSVIHGRTFERCDVFGPAVVIGRDSEISFSQLSGSPEETVIEIDHGRGVTGVIVVDHCKFLSCRISGIAIVSEKGFGEKVRGNPTNRVR